MNPQVVAKNITYFMCCHVLLPTLVGILVESAVHRTSHIVPTMKILCQTTIDCYLCVNKQMKKVEETAVPLKA